MSKSILIFRVGLFSVLILTGLISLAVFADDDAKPAQPKKETNRSVPLGRVRADRAFAERGGKQRFPDFKLEYLPPENQYKGLHFCLNQDYPTVEPKIADDEELVKLLKMPYDTQETAIEYLNAVRDYCFAGNMEARDHANPRYEDDWQQENPVRAWYHVPWQHFGEKGREGIHGMTREATARPGQLGPGHTGHHQTHAVALYNQLGGYTIGKVWEDQFDPNPRAAIFPIGTVVVKVLFTQAKEDEIPYLHNPLTWKAYIQDPQSPNDPSKRKVQSLRLLQMDVMVRDPRAKESGGWIFGTYCYNGAVNAKNRWYNLVPVGIQWGNDPDLGSFTENAEFTNPHPTTTKINPKLKQTIINKSSDLPAQHLGWGGRLNGPADYFRSSCMSCHSTAQYPGYSPQHPDFVSSLEHEPGDKNWMRWFRNLDCGESFDTTEETRRRAISTDYSLQLQIGVEHFYRWKAKVMEGNFTFRNNSYEPTSEKQPQQQK